MLKILKYIEISYKLVNSWQLYDKNLHRIGSKLVLNRLK